jgi:hypothetical protein
LLAFDGRTHRGEHQAGRYSRFRCSVKPTHPVSTPPALTRIPKSWVATASSCVAPVILRWHTGEQTRIPKELGRCSRLILVLCRRARHLALAHRRADPHPKELGRYSLVLCRARHLALAHRRADPHPKELGRYSCPILGLRRRLAQVHAEMVVDDNGLHLFGFKALRSSQNSWQLWQITG